MVEKCPRCEREVTENHLICPNCGALLPRESSSTIQTSAEMVKKAVLSGWGSSQLEGSTEIVIYPEDASKPLMVDVSEEVTIGRSGHQVSPTVDLKPHGAMQKGVSRKHAALHLAEGELTIVDLDSKNGTFLNGRQLTPNKPYTVSDGDNVRLGTLVMHIYFKR